MTGSGDGFRLLSKTGVFVRCAGEAWRVARRPDVLLAMLPLLLAEWGALAWVASFPHPPWGDLWAPLYRAAGGEIALHYPDSWAALPLVFSWLDRGVVWLAGSFAFAGTIALLPGAFLGEPFAGGRAFRVGASRGGAALVASLPVLLIGGAAIVAMDRIGATALPVIPMLPVDSMFAIGMTAIDWGARSLLAFAVIAVVRGNHGPLSAIGRSITFASHHFWTTVGLLVGVGIPAALLRGFRGDPSARFGKEAPEMAALWVAAEVFLAWVGWIVWVGATTRLWLHFEESRDEASGNGGMS